MPIGYITALLSQISQPRWIKLPMDASTIACNWQRYPALSCGVLASHVFVGDIELPAGVGRGFLTREGQKWENPWAIRLT